MTPALLLSLLLSCDPALVTAVYDLAGIDGVAVVWCESQFNRKAVRQEPEGTSWGLWQLYDKYHNQYRHDLWQHLVTGAAHLVECKETAGGDFVRAVSIYNSGSATRSLRWGERVKRERDRLEWWLWRRMR